MRTFSLGAALLAAATATTVAWAHEPSSSRHRPNPIVIENRHAGSDLWRLPWPGYTVADDVTCRSRASPPAPPPVPGGEVELKVTVTPAQAFQVDVFRLGYYGGHGARHMKHIDWTDGNQQRPCASDAATGLLACRWRTAVRFDVPEHWLSGVYVAVVTSASNYQSMMPFWVLDRGRHSDLLFVSSLNTYQAYNDFPYDPDPSDPAGRRAPGRSLYGFSSAGGVPAVKVSFDRPFSSQYGGPGDGGVFDFEPELIAFLERSGYDVTTPPIRPSTAAPRCCCTTRRWSSAATPNTGRAPPTTALWPRGPRGWGWPSSAPTRSTGRSATSRTRAGRDRRVMVGYKDAAPDPVDDPELRTIKWRDLGRPEQRLIGIQFPTDGNQDWGGQPYLPQNTDHWAYASTGFSAGVPINVEAVGYEIDNYDPAVGMPEGTEYTLLASSPFLNFAGASYTHNSSIYRGSGGNWVWATGSMDWAWTLSPGGSSGARTTSDRRRRS
jgi:hypothetical protein